MSERFSEKGFESIPASEEAENLVRFWKEKYAKEQALRILDSDTGCPKCEIEWANDSDECPHCGTFKPSPRWWWTK